jgi:hypothetical protein
LAAAGPGGPVTQFYIQFVYRATLPFSLLFEKLSFSIWKQKKTTLKPKLITFLFLRESTFWCGHYLKSTETL